MTIQFSVSFNDPGSTYAAYYSSINSNVLAAAQRWGEYFISDAAVEISIEFEDGNGSGRAGGGSVTTAPVEKRNGLNTFQQGAAHEIVTGTDPNGTSPDITIGLAPGYLVNELWFDPTPKNRSVAGPANRTDAVSVFEHEIGHALAFNGWRDWGTGNLSTDYQSVFDSFVVHDSGVSYFSGANVVSVYGSAVALTMGNIYHYGNNAPNPGSDLVPGGLMNGIVYNRGFLYEIAPVDIAFMKDVGLPVNDLIGYRSDDVINGGSGNDVLKGFEGNDTLNGGAGNNFLYGAEGHDIAVYDGARAGFQVTRAEGQTQVSGAGVLDALSSIEILQFDDVLYRNVNTPRDFTADGRDDVLLFHEAGYVVVWEMGEAGKSDTKTSKEGLSTGWQMRPGDFNDDGHADILLNHQNGSVVLWEMRSGTIVDNSTVGTGISPSWNMTVGELTGDGRADIFLNHENGAVVIWERQTDGGINSITVREGLSSDWNILIGDITGDGQADIFLHHANGAVVLWEMNHGNIVKSTTIREGLSTDWNISIADLSGDGRSDVILHHQNGALITWTMESDRIAASTTIGEGLSAGSTIAAGHFSGDSDADLLLHHQDGSVVLWRMSELEVAGNIDVATGVSPAWTII